MKKIQFIEAYDLGSSQATVRSFSPQNALPQVTTHFHNDRRGTASDLWRSWYYFAHGNRGKPEAAVAHARQSTATWPKQRPRDWARSALPGRARRGGGPRRRTTAQRVLFAALASCGWK